MIIYVDGACSFNGSAAAVGGFGAIVLDDNENFITSYHKHCDGPTSNNREELKAILYTQLIYGNSEDRPLVYSDSAYAVNTLTNWVWGWAERNWTKADNKTPENLDLIQTFYDYWLKGYRINLCKCAGHAGNHWNEQADKLAVAAKNNNSKEVIIKLLKKGNIDEYKNI